MEEHEKKYAKRCNTLPVRDLMNSIRTQLCSAIELVLEGNIQSCESSRLEAKTCLFLVGVLTDDEVAKKNYYQSLYEMLKSHTMPAGFFFELVQQLQSDAVRFQNVFSPLLLIIRTEAQRGSQLCFPSTSCQSVTS